MPGLTWRLDAVSEVPPLGAGIGPPALALVGYGLQLRARPWGRHGRLTMTMTSERANGDKWRPRKEEDYPAT